MGEVINQESTSVLIKNLHYDAFDRRLALSCPTPFQSALKWSEHLSIDIYIYIVTYGINIGIQIILHAYAYVLNN